jgi:hypothetical protein
MEKSVVERWRGEEGKKKETRRQSRLCDDLTSHRLLRGYGTYKAAYYEQPEGQAAALPGAGLEDLRRTFASSKAGMAKRSLLPSHPVPLVGRVPIL